MTQHTPNARLIVAAPDLLDALEQALDDMGGEGHCVCETVKQQMRAAVAKATQPMTDEQSMITTVARAICKSRTCEGVNCCQWPANRGRIKCPVDAGGYDDAAFEAILAMGAAESDTSLRDRFGLGRDEKIA
jgi:hypothetical protein